MQIDNEGVNHFGINDVIEAIENTKNKTVTERRRAHASHKTRW